MRSLTTLDMGNPQESIEDFLNDCDDMPDFDTQALPRVHCVCCGDDHLIRDVECIRVEESVYGEDVLEFRCPDLGAATKALVYLG